jgi:tetratricopeptide (TPR) repeat protein
MYGSRALHVAAALLWACALPASAEAFEAGKPVPEVTLKEVGGGTAPVVDRTAAVNALVFFRAPHDRSEETLKMLAACQPKLAGKPVRFVGLVPADSAEAAKASVAASGAKLPVLVDEDDAVYAALGVRLHPGIAIADRTRSVVAFEPYHAVDFCEIVVARVRHALGELSDAELAAALAPRTSALPGGDDHGGVAHRHVAFGKKLLASKAYAPAHAELQKALQAAPSAEAWRVEGEIFAAEGKCAEAVKAFDAALAIDPRDAGAAAGKKGCAK